MLAHANHVPDRIVDIVLVAFTFGGAGCVAGYMVGRKLG
jgi:hypothetical protein